MTTPRHLILGTAGHIDHGKTSLVKALTGTDTDRLPEEKRRGITIELGFAELNLGDVVFGVVDVPGHERFVRTMVSGATGIDVALLVVAADDSVMPQTVEHVEILSLLGVRRGVVAITKADLADQDMIDLIREEVAELLYKSGLPDWRTIAVSSATSTGLDDLRQALTRAVETITEGDQDPVFRLAIDRVFTRPGRGTVVTGSVIRGCAAPGDELDLLPKGLQVRVRDAQSHGREAAAVGRGQRAALNLSGVDRDQIAPGDELATLGYLTPAQIIDAEVTFVSSLAQPVKPMSRIRFAAGTREVVARFVPLFLPAGAPPCLAQFRLAEPVVVEYGQRFILRSENAARTLGGGRVLRFGARRSRRAFLAAVDGLGAMQSPDDLVRLEEALRLSGFDRPTNAALAATAGVSVAQVPAKLTQLEKGGRLVRLTEGFDSLPVGSIEGVSRRAAAWLDRFHRARPDEPGCPIDRLLGWLESKSRKGLGRVLLDRMVKSGGVKSLGRYVCLPAFAPALSAQDERILADILAELESATFQPPTPSHLRAAKSVEPKRIERLLKVATAHGALVRIDADTYLTATIEQGLRDTVRGMAESGDEITVAAVREKLNSSRKYVVPFLEHLDRTGFTRRIGDARVLTDSPMKADVR